MELTIEQALQQGLAFHKAGKLKEAEGVYRAILQAQPGHPDVNHNLAVLLISAKRTDEALTFFKAALQSNPKTEQFWLSYLNALITTGNVGIAQQVLKNAEKQGFSGEKFHPLREKLIQKKDTGAASPSQQQLNELVQHYQSRRYEEAQNIAEAITEQFPNHQFSWKVLGAVLKQTGRLSESLIVSEKAVALVPQDAEAHISLASTLKELGRSEEAEASYRQAISLNSDLPEAHMNLGNLLKELDRLEEAEASYRKAIVLKSDFAAAYNNLGSTQQKLGKLEDAEKSYMQAIALNPNNSDTHYNLGNTLNELRKFQEAEVSYKKAIALKSDFSKAYSNLGNMLHELGRLEEAEENHRQAIVLSPNNAAAHNNLGGVLKDMGRLENAEVIFRKTIALKGDFAEAHNNLGSTLQDLGRLEDAETSYRNAINLKSNLADAFKNLGVLFIELGRSDDATAMLIKATELKPDYAEAHRYLGNIKKFTERDMRHIEKIYSRANISDEDRCHLGFALGKAYEDLNKFDTSFKHYSEGNVLRKKMLGYNISQDNDHFERLKKSSLTLKAISSSTFKISNEIKPIFILGMPRSGTTLVEQIISAHSQVMGAGELRYIDQLGGSMALGFSEINSKSLCEFRENYLNKLLIHSNGSTNVTDKMPLNFRYIGLIATAFPESKIIHVKRNPAATCWGNYKQYFVSKGLGFAYNLSDLAEYYSLYHDLMLFWQEQYVECLYNLDYELLTTNQEEETKKLLQYLDLDWQEDCLEPHKNTRRIATASQAQVRRKIYQGSSQEWKKFKTLINGAFDELIEFE